MRAHFGSEVVAIAASPDDDDKATNEPDQLELDQPTLEQRVQEFKQDPKNMEIVSEFIEEVLQKAGDEVNKRQPAKAKNPQQTKEKSRQSFSIPDFKNGKVVNRARGLVVRIFDAIGKACVGAATPVPRMKLRVKRASASATGGSSGGGGAGGNGVIDQHDKNTDAKDTKLKKLEIADMGVDSKARDVEKQK